MGNLTETLRGALPFGPSRVTIAGGPDSFSIEVELDDGRLRLSWTLATKDVLFSGRRDPAGDALRRLVDQLAAAARQRRAVAVASAAAPPPAETPAAPPREVRARSRRTTKKGRKP